MRRHVINTRPDWQKKVEELGFSYHTLDGAMYWDEHAFYEFSLPEINLLEESTTELHCICLEAVDHVIEKKLFDWFSIPEEFIPLVKKSWEEESPSIYGRFDICL